MRHFLTLIACFLLVAACSSEITENRETRSTVYKGQTTWDLYENFGVPTGAVHVSDNETHFYYHRELITRDWAHLFYDFCNMTFVVVDDRVVDWRYDGNMCSINVAESVPGYESAGKSSQPKSEDKGDRVYDESDSFYGENYRDTLF